LHVQIFNILRNQKDTAHYLELGWFAVRNRNSEEILDASSFEERDRKEIQLFDSGKWKEAVSSPDSWKSIDPNVLGVKYLKVTLQRSLYKRVKENFPLLKTRMRNMKLKYEHQLESMGKPRDDEQKLRLYLGDIQKRYENEVKMSLNGPYRPGLHPGHPSRLRYHVKNLNMAFQEEMEQKAFKYAWILPDGFDGDKFESCEEPSRSILQWIPEVWNHHIGSEPRNDVPSNLKLVLVREQTNSWERRARKYIEKVEKAISDCNADLFKITCVDDALRAKIHENLEAIEINAFAVAKNELDDIIRDLDYIDSWHPSFLPEIKSIQDRRLFIASQNKPLIQLEDPAKHLEHQKTLFKDFQDANSKYLVHDWLYAYWKMAFPRFVDNVIIQVVERHLLGLNGPLKIFSREWVDGLNKVELEKLVGEDENTINERKAIKERIQGLDDALENAAIAMR
jgi:hypothetical protein